MPLKIILTGSHGMVGGVLKDDFARGGHQVLHVIRAQNMLSDGKIAGAIVWDIKRQQMALEGLEGADMVIHLAGAGIADHRWTSSYKKLIYNSRVLSTRLLAQSFIKLKNKPKLLVCASAIGFYGNHAPSKVLTEDSPQGFGFLSEVCHEWEKEAHIASEYGIRVVNLRFGIILGKKGALGKMLPVFKMGLGGPLGDGTQMMSWISVHEIPKIIEFIRRNEGISGPVNCVAPVAVSNREFTKTLGGVLRRPTVLPAPAFMVRLALGEMGQELLLEGVQVKPQKLLQAGYTFEHGDLRAALTEIIYAK